MKRKYMAGEWKVKGRGRWLARERRRGYVSTVRNPFYVWIQFLQEPLTEWINGLNKNRELVSYLFHISVPVKPGKHLQIHPFRLSRQVPPFLHKPIVQALIFACEHRRVSFKMFQRRVQNLSNYKLVICLMEKIQLFGYIQKVGTMHSWLYYIV